MISGIVLAAGSATRFGSTKQLADLDGRPLAQRAIDALASAGIRDVVVVVGHEAARVRAALTLPIGARIVVADRYADGMSASLAAGIAALGDQSTAVVVLLADQPGITADHVTALTSAFADGDVPIVRLRFDDGPGPALLAREVWGEVTSLRGDVGARALIGSDPSRVREVRVTGPAPRDVDVPADLAALRVSRTGRADAPPAPGAPRAPDAPPAGPPRRR